MKTTRVWAALALAVAVSACAPLPPASDENGAAAPPATNAPAPGESGEAAAPATAGAVATLLAQSRSYHASDEYAEAATTLERALRIEPANPWLWLELAKVHVSAGNLPQAEAHARKALSVAGGDTAAREAAEDLLARIAAG
ncbi:MAG TPA: tetratricopeptide repeat protein [Woeseiaceae bacterium]|nr:tetratricopeptide repeat protein [Woeseiaceae bacterium]